jgi:NAD(P)-dependent dehydrogenase (short-subunit alcohol dehydrogenase family)
VLTCCLCDRNGYLGGRSKGEDDVPVIINVSSLLGLQGGYGAVAYAASKAGVLGFTRALATEYASHKVRVNAIVPGYVETDMTKGTQVMTLLKKEPPNNDQT